MRLFISHIHEEVGLARVIRDELGNCFAKQVEVFLAENIPLGTNWLKEVQSTLAQSEIALVLFSRESVSRPWINIEAGYGVMAGKQVVPICHSGFPKANLPIIYALLQAVEATNADDTGKLLDQIAGNTPAGRLLVDRSEAIHRWVDQISIASARHSVTPSEADREDLGMLIKSISAFQPAGRQPILASDRSDPDTTSSDPPSSDLISLFIALGMVKVENGQVNCVSESAEAFIASLRAHFLDRHQVYWGDWKGRPRPMQVLREWEQFPYFGDWASTETEERPRLAEMLEQWEQYRLRQWEHYRERGVVDGAARPSRFAQTAVALIRADLAGQPRFIMLENPKWNRTGAWWFVGGGSKPQDYGDLGTTVEREVCEELALQQRDLSRPHSLGTTQDRRISKRIGLDTDYFYEVFTVQILRPKAGLFVLEGHVKTEERTEHFRWMTFDEILGSMHLKEHAECILRVIARIDPQSVPKSGDLRPE